MFFVCEREVVGEFVLNNVTKIVLLKLFANTLGNLFVPNGTMIQTNLLPNLMVVNTTSVMTALLDVLGGAPSYLLLFFVVKIWQ